MVRAITRLRDTDKFIMLAIIQARMSSSRLPGKALLPMLGIPLIQRVYDRLTLVTGITKIVIATSDERSDDVLCEYCSQQNIPYFRASLDDVALRLLSCAKRERVDSFIRISGDSPLIDPAVVDKGISLYNRSPCDLATNVLVRSYPKGQSVEVIRTEALADLYDNLVKLSDREHVTSYFYAHPKRYTIKNFSSGRLMGNIQLSVDTCEDFKALERILCCTGGCVSWEVAGNLKANSLMTRNGQCSELGS